MEIEITYQTWDDTSPVRCRLAPDEYFDPLELGETFQEHGIPKYDETWRYLDVPEERLMWSSERRSGTGSDATFTTQYMDGGRSWLTHVVTPGGYEELIHVTQLDDRTCHIIRTVKPVDAVRWGVCYNGVFRRQEDGSDQERRFDAPWTSEAIQSYCLSARA